MGRVFEDLGQIKERSTVLDEIAQHLSRSEELPEGNPVKERSHNLLIVMQVKIGRNCIAKKALRIEEEVKSLKDYNFFLNCGLWQIQNRAVTREEEDFYVNTNMEDLILLKSIQDFLGKIHKTQFLKSDFLEIARENQIIQFIRDKSLNCLDSLNRHRPNIISENQNYGVDLAVNFLKILAGKPIDTKDKLQGRALYSNQINERKYCREDLTFLPQIRFDIEEILSLVEFNQTLQGVLFGNEMAR